MKKRYMFVAALALCLMIYMKGPSDHSIRSRVMKLTSPFGLCSGEQVRAPSGIDYVLTAAHCKGLIDATGSITVTTEDGKVLKRRVIAEDGMSDLLLLEGVPGIKGLDIASWDYARQHVRTFTHGNRFDTYKTDGVLIQDNYVQVMLSLIDTPEKDMACHEPKNSIVDVGFGLQLCILQGYETVTTAMIVPGSSGGPVVDDSGSLIGVVSAGDGHFGYLVRLVDIKFFLRSY